MEKQLIDDMKREAKYYAVRMLFGDLCIAVFLLYHYFEKDQIIDKDFVLISVFFSLLFFFGILSWLYMLKFSIEIQDDVLLCRTLFGKKAIHLSDISLDFKVKTRRKAEPKNNELVLITLDTPFGKTRIYTRYANEFLSVLRRTHGQEEEMPNESLDEAVFEYRQEVEKMKEERRHRKQDLIFAGLFILFILIGTLILHDR